MNIALVLEMAADTDPDRIGLFCDGKAWSYGELLRSARGAARLIRSSNAETVVLLDESSAASAIALFGAAIAGVPFTPLNYRLADNDLGALIARTLPAYVIGDVNRARKVTPDALENCVSREGFIAAICEADGSPLEESDQAIAIQLFTSGTTAKPKAAILRHANLLSYIFGTVEFCSAKEADGALVCVPPYHIAGIAALLSSVYAMRRILMLPAFSPEAWLSLATQQKATNAFVVPTMLSRIIPLLSREGDYDLSTLTSIAYGGGKMPIELIHQALILMPETNFTNAYGLTETSSTIALLGPEDHRASQKSDDPDIRARLASVGHPLPTVEVEIRDDEGKVLPAGERGEIYVRGEQVSGEYKGRSALDAHGWFPTRDGGYLDKDGYLFLSGRADDVIVRGGENISPGEIEDVLLSHDAIIDACAVAIPSAEWGEDIGIAIVTRDGVVAPSDENIKSLIKSRLRSSRLPKVIIHSDALPYNEMGKLLRRRVKLLF